MAHDTRERILEACSICIARDGVRGMRMQDVCKQAGVSTGLVYYHFTDRDGLLAATLEYANVHSLGARERPGMDRTTPHAKLRHTLMAEIQDDPRLRAKSIVWNEIRAIAVFEPALAGHLATSTTAWQSHIASLLEQCSPAGAENCEQSALVLTALVEGLSSRWLSGQLDTAAARIALENGLDAVLRATA